MGRTVTYRRLVAAAFLLLYIFIAAPVQLWHSHHIAKKQIVVLKKGHTAISTQNEDCKICQHTYAGYTVADLFSTAHPFAFRTITHQVVAINYCPPFSSTVSNKGPPKFFI